VLLQALFIHNLIERQDMPPEKKKKASTSNQGAGSYKGCAI
jgi:hypothetical protein